MINIKGKIYDLNRCTKEQLAAYVADFLQHPNCFVAKHGYSQNESGNVVLAAARVETKDDVARDIAESMARNLYSAEGLEIGVVYADELRRLAARYRKAVGQ